MAFTIRAEPDTMQFIFYEERNGQRKIQMLTDDKQIVQYPHTHTPTSLTTIHKI